MGKNNKRNIAYAALAGLVLKKNNRLVTTENRDHHGHQCNSFAKLKLDDLSDRYNSSNLGFSIEGDSWKKYDEYRWSTSNLLGNRMYCLSYSSLDQKIMEVELTDNKIKKINYIDLKEINNKPNHNQYTKFSTSVVRNNFIYYVFYDADLEKDRIMILNYNEQGKKIKEITYHTILESTKYEEELTWEVSILGDDNNIYCLHSSKDPELNNLMIIKFNDTNQISEIKYHNLNKSSDEITINGTPPRGDFKWRAATLRKNIIYAPSNSGDTNDNCLIQIDLNKTKLDVRYIDLSTKNTIIKGIPPIGKYKWRSIILRNNDLYCFTCGSNNNDNIIMQIKFSDNKISSINYYCLYNDNLINYKWYSVVLLNNNIYCLPYKEYKIMVVKFDQNDNISQIEYFDANKDENIIGKSPNKNLFKWKTAVVYNNIIYSPNFCKGQNKILQLEIDNDKIKKINYIETGLKDYNGFKIPKVPRNFELVINDIDIKNMSLIDSFQFFNPVFFGNLTKELKMTKCLPFFKDCENSFATNIDMFFDKLKKSNSDIENLYKELYNIDKLIFNKKFWELLIKYLLKEDNGFIKLNDYLYVKSFDNYTTKNLKYQTDIMGGKINFISPGDVEDIQNYKNKNKNKTYMFVYYLRNIIETDKIKSKIYFEWTNKD